MNTASNKDTTKLNNFEASGMNADPGNNQDSGLYGNSKRFQKGNVRKAGPNEAALPTPVAKLPFVSQSVSGDTLRYDVKIPLYDTFVYARQVSPQELAELRAANRKLELESKPLKREKARLEREYATLEKQEFQDEESFEERDARLDEIDARLADILERAEVLTASEKGLISDLVNNHVVAASWEVDGRDIFTREVQFSAIGDEIEVGQILVAYSQAGNSVLDALKGR